MNTLYRDKLDPWSSHSVIKSWLINYPSETRILEIGTATGTLGRMCAAYGFVWRGIEPNHEWSNVAIPYYHELLVNTLECTPDEYLQGNDIVICADVLEHIPYPINELKRLVKLQDKTTTFIISVPNIANIWIRVNLLFGRFEYTKRGILDFAHLRFFTRRSLLEMLASVGLQHKKLSTTPIPINLINPLFESTDWGRLTHRSLAWFTTVFPTLLGYQFVVKAKINNSNDYKERI